MWKPWKASQADKKTFNMHILQSVSFKSQFHSSVAPNKQVVYRELQHLIHNTHKIPVFIISCDSLHFTTSLVADNVTNAWHFHKLKHIIPFVGNLFKKKWVEHRVFWFSINQIMSLNTKSSK